ncbi:MAG: hypothetical protein ABSF56_02420 [Minisyncoccia bacterium]|jgi:hypothetical protein
MQTSPKKISLRDLFRKVGSLQRLSKLRDGSLSRGLIRLSVKITRLGRDCKSLFWRWSFLNRRVTLLEEASQATAPVPAPAVPAATPAAAGAAVVPGPAPVEPEGRPEANKTRSLFKDNMTYEGILHRIALAGGVGLLLYGFVFMASKMPALFQPVQQSLEVWTAKRSAAADADNAKAAYVETLNSIQTAYKASQAALVDALNQSKQGLEKKTWGDKEPAAKTEASSSVTKVTTNVTIVDESPKVPSAENPPAQAPEAVWYVESYPQQDREVYYYEDPYGYVEYGWWWDGWGHVWRLSNHYVRRGNGAPNGFHGNRGGQPPSHIGRRPDTGQAPHGRGTDRGHR